MAIEIKVPAVGESISEVEIGAWLKPLGAGVRRDEPFVILESEKATVELPCPENGTLTRILKLKGEVAKVGETIAYMERGEAPAGLASAPAGAPAPVPTPGPTPKAAEPVAGAEPRIMPAAQALISRGGWPTGLSGWHRP